MKIFLALFLVCLSTQVQAFKMVKGFNLTEYDNFVYDASPLDSHEKLPAQLVIDQLKALGVNHILLNPRAIMKDPRDSNVVPLVKATGRSQEEERYGRLIDYIKSLGMTVGIRPIFFVVKPDGTFPYIETLPDGTIKNWWHGNIQPRDPEAWFQSFLNYINIYLSIAIDNEVEEFTLGAELYSMTIGVEDQWKEFPYGFPGKWLALLRYVKSKVPPSMRIMYDINFTDDNSNSSQLSSQGGELERWRFRLVNLKNPTNPLENEIWKDLVEFWKELDAIGIDMYRSLAGAGDKIPENPQDLVDFLQIRSDAYADQLNSVLKDIKKVTKITKPIIFKEIGYRSSLRGFIDPFNYTERGAVVNVLHQAASFRAFFNSFWTPGWEWFQGVSFWDASINIHLQGMSDAGFSPLNKELTEKVIKEFWLNSH